jgi:HEAT repeat protein
LVWARSDYGLVVRALIEKLADSNSLVRCGAADALGNLHAELALSIPALTNALAGNSTPMRQSVLLALGRFGSDARGEIPFVVTFLHDPDPIVRGLTTNALKEIDPETAKRMGIK